MSGLFVSLPLFPFQVWPDLEWNQDSADRHGELLRPLTRSCFLLPLLRMLSLLALPFLLGTCHRSLWSPPFSSPCSRSDPPLIRQGAALAHLDSLSITIWCFGLTVLFLFLLAKAALRPLFPFQQAQYVQIFPLKPAPFCKLFAGLGSTNKSATSLLLQYDSRSVLSSIFPFTSISLAGTVFSLLLFYQATMGPRTLVSPGKQRGWWTGQTGSAIRALCNLSPLIPDWKRTVSSKFFDTQLLSISTEELVLPRHARCVLSRLSCNGHSLLLSSYLSRIGRIENPCAAPADLSSHSALSSYGLFAPLALWRLSISLRPLVQALGSCPASGASLSSAMPPSLRRVWVTTTTTCYKLCTWSCWQALHLKKLVDSLYFATTYCAQVEVL